MTTAEVWLPLSRGKVTVIDFDDFEKFRGVKFYASKGRHTFYACHDSRAQDGSGPMCYLHREIMQPGEGFEVDHINGDGLDNRRANLRIVTRSQNMVAHQTKRLNATSKFRGVSWHEFTKKWMARLRFKHRSFYLGVFLSEESAARAYDTKARELFGAHAACNFLQLDGLERIARQCGFFVLPSQHTDKPANN